MATLAAIRSNSKVKALYEKLLAKGMAKIAAICACSRKLVMILYGILRAHLNGQTPIYHGEKRLYRTLHQRQVTVNPKKLRPNP